MPVIRIDAAGLERIRERLPEGIAAAARVIVDNPGPFALLVAGDVVLMRILANLVKPKTPAQGAAVMVVSLAALPLLNRQAVERGWVKLRVRDENGDLVPYRPE